MGEVTLGLHLVTAYLSACFDSYLLGCILGDYPDLRKHLCPFILNIDPTDSPQL